GVRVLAQALMEAEVSSPIGGERYERTDERTAYRNCYPTGTWDTRVGTLELAIPKVRPGSYLPSLLEPRRRGRTGDGEPRSTADGERHALGIDAGPSADGSLLDRVPEGLETPGAGRRAPGDLGRARGHQEGAWHRPHGITWQRCRVPSCGTSWRSCRRAPARR